MEIKRISLGDVLVMKKPHPCAKNANRFKVMMLGSDLKIRCLECGREIIAPRAKLERNIKTIESIPEKNG